jgi:hypothetical protein
LNDSLDSLKKSENFSNSRPGKAKSVLLPNPERVRARNNASLAVKYLETL